MSFPAIKHSVRFLTAHISLTPLWPKNTRHPLQRKLIVQIWNQSADALPISQNQFKNKQKYYKISFCVFQYALDMPKLQS